MSQLLLCNFLELAAAARYSEPVCKLQSHEHSERKKFYVAK